MKKTALILMALLPAMMGWAQDTVDKFNFARDGYYYNNIPDLKKNFLMEWVPTVGNYNGIVSKELYVRDKEPLKVYGVAASMMTMLDMFWMVFPNDSIVAAEGIDTNAWLRDGFFAFCRDSSTENCYEYLGIYLADADSIVAQRNVMVHRRYDRPAFYYETTVNCYGNMQCYPMYEKYFDSSVVVTDTFYVGVTQRTLGNFVGPQDSLDFGLVSVIGAASNGFCETHVYRFNPEEQRPGYVEWVKECERMYYMIFPILTPDPDTAGGDTLAVTQADMVGRYVSVQPNPAMDEARVLSSFGLRGIEAYNAEGRLVSKQEAAGLEATLDVKAWPRGTYILRILTPMGVVTKKLMVN